WQNSMDTLFKELAKEMSKVGMSFQEMTRELVKLDEALGPARQRFLALAADEIRDHPAPKGLLKASPTEIAAIMRKIGHPPDSSAVLLVSDGAVAYNERFPAFLCVR